MIKARSIFYSLDSKKWISIGKTMKLPYTFPHFMDYRFALFNYAAKSVGGSDFDYLYIKDRFQKIINRLSVAKHSSHN